MIEEYTASVLRIWKPHRPFGLNTGSRNQNVKTDSVSELGRLVLLRFSGQFHKDRLFSPRETSAIPGRRQSSARKGRWDKRSGMILVEQKREILLSIKESEIE